MPEAAPAKAPETAISLAKKVGEIQGNIKDIDTQISKLGSADLTALWGDVRETLTKSLGGIEKQLNANPKAEELKPLSESLKQIGAQVALHETLAGHAAGNTQSIRLIQTNPMLDLIIPPATGGGGASNSGNVPVTPNMTPEQQGDAIRQNLENMTNGLFDGLIQRGEDGKPIPLGKILQRKFDEGVQKELERQGRGSSKEKSE